MNTIIMNNQIRRLVLVLMTVSMLLTGITGCGSKNKAGEEEASSYKLYLDIDFNHNFLFNKYDVTVLLDNKIVGEIDHGDYFTKLLDISKGKHVVKFVKEDDDSVSGERSFTIKGDSTFKCSITSESETVDIDEFELIDGIEGAGIELDDVTGMILSEAIEVLEEKGFINIHQESDSSIWDQDNWIVISQNIVPGTLTDKNAPITLSCIKLDKYFNDAYSGKTLKEVQELAESKGYSLNYISSSGEKNIEQKLAGLTDKEKTYWVVDKAEQDSSEKYAATIYVSYKGSPEEIAAAEAKKEEEARKAAEEKKKKEEEAQKAAEEKKKREEEEASKKTENAVEENNTETAEEDKTKQSADAVNYSTNNKDTVKNGNSGVYSYKKSGGSYSIYYIIDFDEQYVYSFTNGNGNEICERLKIDSGDLNTVLMVTYHDGDDVWQNGLHFKYRNQPDHLIVQDNDGFEDDYYSTDLKEALSLRNQKTIHDY